MENTLHKKKTNNAKIKKKKVKNHYKYLLKAGHVMS